VIIQIEGEVSEQTTEDEKITTEAVSESDDDAGSVVGTIEVAGKNDIMAPSDEGEKDIEEKTSVSRKALATPVARAMAKQMGIDINQIPGSGPSGRVKKEDILNFKSTGLDIKPESDIIKKSFTPDESLKQTAGDVTYKPLTQIRKTIAKNMLQSKHNAAHMSVFEEVEISGLMEVRSRYKQRFADKGVKLTYLPFIVKAVAQALKHHPQLNSQIDTENNRMIYRNRYHIGIAVDAPDGLVVPVIRDADKLSIFQIAGQIGELANKARTRKLTLEDLKDGCFSITSFGSFGGIYATPVLNYPQAGILGIGRILKTPVVKDDEIVIGNIMPLSLTVDHRVVDGGETTRFIYKVMEYLTDPISFLMEE
jgi:pyruvate dehydrogenase E2 component (dihydrolipoamide acetyltransferase)